MWQSRKSFLAQRLAVTSGCKSVEHRLPRMRDRFRLQLSPYGVAEAVMGLLTRRILGVHLGFIYGTPDPRIAKSHSGVTF